jgi:hypothetical protein
MKKNVTKLFSLIIIGGAIAAMMMVIFLPITAKAASQTGVAQNIKGDKLVFGSTFTLSEGQTLEGSLIVFGGNATILSESLVGGDAVVMGGTLSADGTIAGSVVTFGGIINLSDTAVVGGDVVEIGGELEYDVDTRIEGEIISGTSGPFQFSLPQFNQASGTKVPNFRMWVNPVWDFLWYLFRSVMWAALAMLVVLFLPQHTSRAAQAAVSEPVLTAGLGLLTIVVAPIILIVIAITIIGIPISLLAILLLVILWVFGLIVIGTEVGKRLARMLKVDWALAVSAGIGTLLLTLVVNGINELVPCIGWLAPAFVGVVGLGAVLLTRFGTQKYPPVSTVLPPPYGGDSPVGVEAEPIVPEESAKVPNESEPETSHSSEWIIEETGSSQPSDVIEKKTDDPSSSEASGTVEEV